MSLDMWRYTDEELRAMVHALDAIERSRAGQHLLEQLIHALSLRQQEQARAEGWHTDGIDWEGV